MQRTCQCFFFPLGLYVAPLAELSLIDNSKIEKWTDFKLPPTSVRPVCHGLHPVRLWTTAGLDYVCLPSSCHHHSHHLA